MESNEIYINNQSQQQPVEASERQSKKKIPPAIDNNIIDRQPYRNLNHVISTSMHHNKLQNTQYIFQWEEFKKKYRLHKQHPSKFTNKQPQVFKLPQNPKSKEPSSRNQSIKNTYNFNVRRDSSENSSKSAKFTK